jgi:phosphoglycerate dehydrogenase-like enzyme
LLLTPCSNTLFSSRNGTTLAFHKPGTWNSESQFSPGAIIMKPITQENDRLGFVGIGYMGRPIAQRLLESGFKLTAYDRDHTKAEELIAYGGKVAPSVSERHIVLPAKRWGCPGHL